MKTQNWKLGVVLALGLSLTGLSFRMVMSDEIDFWLAFNNVLYNFLFCITCWFSHNFLLKKQFEFTSKSGSYIFAGISVVGVGMVIFLYDGIFKLFNDHVLLFPNSASRNKYLSLIFRGVSVSALYYLMVYYLHILSEKQKHSIEIEQLKQAQLDANLSSLKEQLSPHFLFNTLNTLSSLTREKAVKDYIAELANVYRYVLMYKKMDTATLQQELTFIEAYLYIIKTRMETAIEISIKVGDGILQTSIPPLTLQLLIENAIKHNIASASKQLKIDIYNEGNQYLVVSNNLQIKSSIQLGTGIGLANVMQRYNLLFNKDIITEKTMDLFIVKLPIIIQ